MNKLTVQCNNCDFLGMEEDLDKVVEFRESKNSDLTYISLNEFLRTYKNFNNVHEYDIINGCPNCLTDEHLMDIEDECMSNDTFKTI